MKKVLKFIGLTLLFWEFFVNVWVIPYLGCLGGQEAFDKAKDFSLVLQFLKLF